MSINTPDPRITVDADDEETLRRWLELGILPDRPRPADARPSVEEMLGRAVLRLRLFRGWSQRELERRSGVDQSTICRLETARRSNVGSRRLCAILRALRVGDVQFLPPETTVPPTPLELMLHGDPWARAMTEADRRLQRRNQRRDQRRVSRRRNA